MTTVSESIQLKVISLANERIFGRSKTLSEIAYELGFKSPQHFSRVFKNVTGQNPNEYRPMN